MARQSEYLDNIYSVEGGEEMQRYYDRWADSYDADLSANDYRTPARCAQALARHTSDRDAPVLDFACGTGLSGVALKDAGFTCIDGTDVSPGMLERAREKGVYRQLLQADPDKPLDMRGQGYAAIVAVGAIGAGAAPAENLDGAIDSLEPGGLFVVSLNDHTLEDPEFESRLTRAAEAGRVEILEAEHGAHLPSLGLGARVYVLRKL